MQVLQRSREGVKFLEAGLPACQERGAIEDALTRVVSGFCCVLKSRKVSLKIAPKTSSKVRFRFFRVEVSMN